MVELVWAGKYKDGKKVAPVNIPLPFQTIETVNESAQQRQLTLEQFATGRPTEWRNRLIWGDKKYVLPSLLPEFAGKVNLIYIDPPFDTGSDFSFSARISEDEEGISFSKEPSVIEQKAYRDTWGVSLDERRAGVSSLDKYTQWFYETIIFLRELLCEDGTIYIHLDWHAGHYAKVVMDEVFGMNSFRNEIIWWYYDKFPTGGNVLDRQHDSIFHYSRSESFIVNRLEEEREEPGRPTEVRKKVAGKMLRIRDESGKSQFIEGALKKKASDVWKLPLINSMSLERIGYATQKPEALLERIVKASSNEGDLVLDCFAGSGTTAAVAEKFNRRWIVCDLSRFAIHTSRKRLLGIPTVKPFIVQNLGKYERQLWMQAEFENADARATQEKAYRHFILELYHAEALSGQSWLHGVKQGRMVHVGSVDAPVSMGDVKAIVQEFWKLVGSSKETKTNGLDILGWEFAFELNETAKQFAAANNVDLKFKKIPREVLDKHAVEAGDVQFFELGALDVKLTVKGRTVGVTLNNFTIPPDDVPDEARKAISHWSQFVDYWALDWNFRDDTFHNEWQAYRTKKDPKIQLSISYTYPESGKYKIMVKVIDILGNDTTKVLEVEVS